VPPAFAKPSPRPGSLAAALSGVLDVCRLSPYAERSASDYKDEARRNWSAVPCGTDAAHAARHSRTYFDEI